LDVTTGRAYHLLVTEDLRYPAGKFVPQLDLVLSAADRRALIAQLADAPGLLAAEVAGLTDRQLDTPYRPGGWTVRQVVHHVPDSHMNAYIRCKLAVTEDRPPVKTYKEDLWAECHEAKTAPIRISLALLEVLHERWVMWLRSLDDASFARTALHPDWGPMRVDDFLMLYSWHGRHHTAHIHALRVRESW
jgi:uncharacterized damage-inducible protein DinB